MEWGFLKDLAKAEGSSPPPYQFAFLAAFSGTKSGFTSTWISAALQKNRPCTYVHIDSPACGLHYG
jgi:hypothetical protein